MISENVIVDYLKNIAKPVGKKDIIDATHFDGDFRVSIKRLRKKYPEIETTGTTTTTKYCWKSEAKNQEGYPDPTADRALRNIMKSSGKYPMRQGFGEIWSTSVVNEDMEGLLVVSANDGICICYNVYPSKKPYMKDRWTFKWTTDEGTHYISTMNPVNIVERKLGKKLYELSNMEKEALRNYVTAAMNVSSVIETTAYSEREGELETLLRKSEDRVEELEQKLAAAIVPESVRSIDQKDVELAVLKGKLEVYEKVIEAWSKR